MDGLANPWSESMETTGGRTTGVSLGSYNNDSSLEASPKHQD